MRAQNWIQRAQSNIRYFKMYHWVEAIIAKRFFLCCSETIIVKMGRPCINRGRAATKKSEEEQDYSKWDPVKWFSQRGYNVTQMIHAPGISGRNNDVSSRG